MGEKWLFTKEDIEVFSAPLVSDGMLIGIPRGVRVVHKPTGTTIEVVSESSQHKNRHKAFLGLNAILAQ